MARTSFPLNGQFVIHSCDIKNKTYSRVFFIKFLFPHLYIFFLHFDFSPIQKMLLRIFFWSFSFYRLNFCWNDAENMLSIEFIFIFIIYFVLFFTMNFNAKISLAIWFEIRIKNRRKSMKNDTICVFWGENYRHSNFVWWCQLLKRHYTETEDIRQKITRTFLYFVKANDNQSSNISAYNIIFLHFLIFFLFCIMFKD